MRLILVIGAFILSRPLGLATLAVLILLFGGVPGVDWSKLETPDVFRSLGHAGRPAKDCRAQKTLNEIAQAYFFAVYGPGTSLAIRRLRHLSALVLLFLSIVMAVIAVVDASSEAASHFVPLLELLPAMATTTLVVVASFEWHKWQGARRTGTKSRQERRHLEAHRVTAKLGGPRQFIEAVETLYGHTPKLTAPFLVPYWIDTIPAALAIVISFTAALILTAHFMTTGLAWSQLQKHHETATLVVCILDSVLTGYLASIALVTIAHWKATHIGERYYPLQVFCRDLEDVGG